MNYAHKSIGHMGFFFPLFLLLLTSPEYNKYLGYTLYKGGKEEVFVYTSNSQRGVWQCFGEACLETKWHFSASVT